MNYIKDVDLYNNDGTVNVVIEILENTSDKNELVEPFFNKLICERQVIGKYPFYYGSFPQTLAGDNDPLDMILFTNKPHKLLDIVKVDIIGAIKTIDAGAQDDKIICVESDCSLINVKRYLKKALRFLKKYKGKKADMKIDKKLVSMIDAELLVAQANTNFKKPKQAAGTKNSARIRIVQR